MGTSAARRTACSGLIYAALQPGPLLRTIQTQKEKSLDSLNPYDLRCHRYRPAEMADHIFDVCQFLIRLHEEGMLNTHFRPIEETFYYHIPCHLRSLQIGFPALELLSFLIPGLRIIELSENCCGLARTYGFKKDKYAIASEIGRETFMAIREQGAKKVISDCEACRMHIAGHTWVEVLHPVQVLKEAYGE